MNSTDSLFGDMANLTREHAAVFCAPGTFDESDDEPMGGFDEDDRESQRVRRAVERAEINDFIREKL